MKLSITAFLATVLITTAAYSTTKLNNEISENEINDQQYACLWFPICRDPDFHKEQDLKDNIGQEVLFEQLELETLNACLWFPICRDPDLPFADEVTTAELV